MEEGRVSFEFSAPGALSANWVLNVILPWAFMPREISFGGSNAHDATVMIGTASDTDALMTAQAGGDSGTPATVTPSSFADVDYQFAKAANMEITIDFDGASGTAIEDPVLVVSGLTGI